jgi:hypothetical protein
MPARGIAETAKLIASLELKDKLGPGVASAVRSLGKLETRFSRIGAIASRGMATAARNIATIGLAAGSAIVGLVALSVKEGQEAARVELVYAKAIENSGKVTANYVGILNEQQLALMNLAGIDDELIKAEQTKLIQMGLTGKQVADLTPLILDMSKATGKDLLTSTVAVGKAANGTAAGLQRFGVFVDKAKFKVDPFAATMDALNEKFGGTTQALSGTLEARLGALREGLANIREEAGIKLLPALTHIVDVVGKAVVPAFGKFIDRIMPGITGGIDELAKALEGGGAERAISGIADALGTMIGLLEAAAGPVKMIVGAFMSLPKEVQTILVAGFAVNKLTGGMVTQLAGEILFKRGGSPMNPLFVKDVTGGLGGTVPGGGKGGGIASAIGKVFLVGIAAAVAFELAQALGQQSGEIKQQGADLLAATKANSPKMTEKEIRSALANIDQKLRDPLQMFALTMTQPFNDGLKNLLTVQGELNAELARIESGKRLAEPAVGGGRGDVGTAARVAEQSTRSGIWERAVARGMKPTVSALVATLRRNEERAAAAAAVARTASLAAVRAIEQKDFSPRVTVPVTVYSTVSVRGLGVAQTVRASYTRTAGSAVKTGAAVPT